MNKQTGEPYQGIISDGVKEMTKLIDILKGSL